MIVLMSLVSFAGKNDAATAEYARQVTTANLRAAQLEQQLVEAAARIEQLEEFVRTQGRSQAAKLENLDQVNAEVTRLRGEIEVLSHGLQTLQTEVGAQQLSQERRQMHDENRLRQIEEFLAIQPPPPPTNADLGLEEGAEETPLDPTRTGFDPVPKPDPQQPEVPTTAKELLETARKHMEEGRSAVARALLTRGKKDYADAPELAEISYRLAETHFNDENWGKAALAFKGVIDNHPTSTWAPWAMLRQGECFAGLGQNDNARLFFDGVVQRYPKSDAAKEAKKKLAE